MRRFFVLFLFLALIIVVSAFSSMNRGVCQTQNSSGPSAGYAGDPAGNGKTCNHAFCHSGPVPVRQTGWIISNIPATGYMPDSIYTITATAFGPGHVRFGFEATAQNSIGSFLGTLIKTSSQTNLAGINNAYITHNSTGTIGTNLKSWTFNWKAPPAGSDTIIFYGAFNITNNDSMTTGDTVCTSRLMALEDKTSGINLNEVTINSVSVFPNPCNNFIIVKANSSLGLIEIYDYNAKNVYEQKVSDEIKKIDISSLPAGVYTLKVQGMFTTKVIKE
ncbi:MAG TPA: choice-of-anchor V domain-containing protein [Bacteroidia bacterium]|jgi:hypothetical protein|nr:choice-of-anchor V domain-containing protein [Bacteroidia bacterium]